MQILKFIVRFEFWMEANSTKKQINKASTEGDFKMFHRLVITIISSLTGAEIYWC